MDIWWCVRTLHTSDGANSVSARTSQHVIDTAVYVVTDDGKTDDAQHTEAERGLP